MIRILSFVLCTLLFFIRLSFAETIDVQIKGVDDGIKTTKQRDYREACLFAKREAIERAGLKIKSMTTIKDLIVNEDYIKTKAEGVLLPGYNILDMGYSADGTYQVVLVGKILAESRSLFSENEIYKLAKQSFNQGDFDTARDKFQQILKQHPESINADKAQFWIGETFYREKWYEKAILEYQKVIENYPYGNKVQSSLLKQGFAFYNLKDKPNSYLIFKELIKKYPGSNEAKVARRKLKEF